MKKFFSFLILLSGMTVFAQSPTGFNYQAVLRDTKGKTRANENTSISISIIQGSISGNIIYTETHDTKTNEFGLITLEIGSKSSNNFNAINWINGPFFVKITIDGNEMGTSQLLSVPYAKYADKAGNGFSGNYNDLTNKPTYSAVATTGSYDDLSNKPSLSSVAITGSYKDLTNAPTYAAVATSGNYSDLNNKPALAMVATTGSYKDLTNIPALAPVATSGNYNDLTNQPALTAVATTANYYDLINKPALSAVATTGNYNDLNDKPALVAVATTGNYNDLNGKPTYAVVASSGDYNDLINTPSLSSVATTGSYYDLSDKPILSAVAYGGSYSDLTGLPEIFNGDYYSLRNAPDLTQYVNLYNDQPVGGIKTFTNTIIAENGVNAGNKTVSNVATPVNANDAANKAYVDDLFKLVRDIQNGTKLMDYDGNVYKTVKIGSQVWMAENLRAANYSDGTPITFTAMNDSLTAIYGLMYSWTAVMNGAASSGSSPSGVQGVCPIGWHVPSYEEFSTLMITIGGIYAGASLKETGTTHWLTPNTGATDQYGFKALPAGYMQPTINYNIGKKADFWTTSILIDKVEGNTGPGMVELYYNRSECRLPIYPEATAASVRCVKN